jgi:hypothetical protein
MSLTEGEKHVVHECLLAAAEGPFFPDWEFHTLFGMERAELVEITAAWPAIDEDDEKVDLAINNAMNNLLGYPHERGDVWPEYVSVPRHEVDRILWKYRGDEAESFVSGWIEMTRNEDPQFVRYPVSALAPFNASPEDVHLAANAGLPSWAAPHMHFFLDGPTLPPPRDPRGGPLDGVPSGLGMIGCSAEDWPICLDAANSGQVVIIRMEPGYPLQLLNSSFRQLAHSLLAYCEMVERALLLGKEQGHEDAWRKRLYPAEFNTRLRNRMKMIDPAAFSASSYWSLHFLELERPG